MRLQKTSSEHRFKNESVMEVPRTVKPLRLYRHYLSIILRSRMQYKKSFFLSSAGMFLTSFAMFLSIYFMFQRFPYVKGYTYNEVLLCYAIVLMAFTMAEICGRGFEVFPGMVRRGEFDRILLRPRSPILQVLGSQFELARFSRVLQAAVIFVYAVSTCGIGWMPFKAVIVVFMLVGGFGLFIGIFLIAAALSFFTLEGLEFTNILTYGLKDYGKYPFDIYGKVILWILTFIIPFALVQYYPLLYLLGRRDDPGYGFLPLLALLFLAPGYLLWRFGVRHYRSSGS